MPFQGSTYTFEDLSGTTTPNTSTDPNPYIALIGGCGDDPAKIQARYNTHRSARTAQQRALLTSPSFPGLNLDAILIGLIREELKKKKRLAQKAASNPGNGAKPETKGEEEDEGLLRGLAEGVALAGVSAEEREDEVEQANEFVDHRHNLSFWARPPEKIRRLVGECQERLRKVVPDLWLMPLTSLHMTTLELTHSRDPATISSLVEAASPLTPHLASLPYNLSHALPTPLYPSPTSSRRAHLVRPALTYDAAAVALTMVPAASTTITAKGESGERDGKEEGDGYTYHHLRRDLWELLSKTSNFNTLDTGKVRHGAVEVASRYVVPSAHLTVARFVTRWDVVASSESSSTAGILGEEKIDPAKLRAFVEAVDSINLWLEREYWGRDSEGDGEEGKGIEWTVGEEQGLEFHGGSSWFGGGEVFFRGKGI